MQQPLLLVTVDVEEDMPGWRVTRDVSVGNVRALERLQALCDGFGVPPTYLVTYPMVVEEASRRVLRALHDTGRCEVGAHLHPWNTPPLPGGPLTTPLRATEISRKLLGEQLETLTAAIEEAFGRRPTSFRFGRFGVDGPCLIALERLGYLVDSSVTPGISWVDEGGPDFRDAPAGPYFPSRVRPGERGDARILEVPVGTGFTRGIPGWARRLYLHLPRWTHLRGLLSRDYAGWVEHVWLSPWGHPPDILNRVVDDLLARQVPVINLFLHSSELVPGASGYATTGEEVDGLLGTLEAVLAHAVLCGCRGETLSGFRSAWVAGRARSRRDVRSTPQREERFGVTERKET